MTICGEKNKYIFFVTKDNVCNTFFTCIFIYNVPKDYLKLLRFYILLFALKFYTFLK